MCSDLALLCLSGNLRQEAHLNLRSANIRLLNFANHPASTLSILKSLSPAKRLAFPDTYRQKFLLSAFVLTAYMALLAFVP